MKKIIRALLCLSLVYSFGACGNEEIHPGENPDLGVDPVNALLLAGVYPSGDSLQRQYSYHGFHQLMSIEDFYYDESGIRSLRILHSNGDTTSATLYEYDQNGKLIAEKVHQQKNGRYILWSGFQYEYDDEGKLIRTTTLGGRVLRAYTYFEDGKLKQVLLEGRENGECFTFEYDQEGRMLGRSWEECRGGQSPIRKYWYRYDDSGLLKAQETYGIGATTREDVIRYFYNEKNLLVEEREFYPEWDFEPRYRKVLEYYPK